MGDNKTMKHFKIIGPETIREFDIQDDEMLEFYNVKTADHNSTPQDPERPIFTQPTLNEKIYSNEEGTKTGF